MTVYLITVLKAGIALAVFYLVYELLLKRETFFQMNRIYLVSGLVLAFLIPACPVASPFRTPFEALTLDATDIASTAARTFRPIDVLIILYWAGVLVCLIRFGIQLLRLRDVVRRHGVRRLNGVKTVATEHPIPPFSFGDIVFINEDLIHDGDLRRIQAHEEVHIKQGHTFDVLLMEIVVSLQWFNPFVWPYKKALQETHEYLADSGVIAQGFSSAKYKLLIFEQNAGVSLFELGSNFKKSQIKRRIMMLSKAQSPHAAKLKLLVALPLVLGLVLTFAQPRASAGTPALQEKTAQAASTAAPSEAKVLKAKEELDKLAGIEKELRAKLESATDDAARVEIKKKLEMVLKKKQEIETALGHPAGVSGPSAPLSIEELETLAAKLKAKEKDCRELLKTSTDPEQKAKCEETLKKILQKQESVKIELEKARAAKIDKLVNIDVKIIK